MLVDPARSSRQAILSAVLLVLGGIALAYTLARAALLSFTHDESVTYLHFVDAPLLETLRYNGFSPSNNHLLNSLLMRMSATLFGPGELALRLPSWLGHVLYVAAAVLLVRRMRHPLAAVCTFVLLLANPFLLDFFSLARGYGLAMGLMLAGVYVLVTTLEEAAPRPVRAVAAFALLAGAALAHFGFLNVYLAAAAVLLGFALQRRAMRTAGAVAVLSGLFVAGVLPTLLKLKNGGELYHGGEVGFVADTVRSLVESALYGEHPLHRPGRPMALAVAALVLFLASALVVWTRRRRPAAGAVDDGAVVSAIAVVTAVGILLQHHLFGTRFVIDRSALFFLPLFFLTLGAAVDREIEAGGRMGRTLFAGAYGVLSLLLLVHTAGRANLTHTDAWRYDADTERMIEALAARAPSKERPRKTLGVFWAYEPA
ncbi:MAG TPA: hypothetical protein VEL74_15140, partial [Thermoanaerobaculia bacterium]|nr:hypothetical protein [Thermoanaerobaculia bacterium]